MLRHLRCIILHCVVLCCVVLYCVVLCCVVLYCIVLYYVVLCCVMLCCIMLCCIVLYCVVLYCIVLNCIALCCIDFLPQVASSDPSSQSLSPSQTKELRIHRLPSSHLTSLVRHEDFKSKVKSGNITYTKFKFWNA